MSAIDDVIAAIQAVQQQLDAALAQGMQAINAAGNAHQLAVQVGSQSTAAGLEQVTQMIRSMQDQIVGARSSGDAVISTAQQVAAGT